VTDGFRGLERCRAGSNCDAEGKPVGERFGDDRVNAALRNAIATPRSEDSRPAERIAAALVGAARDFRKGCSIPEPSDDDRLVVVIDLASIGSMKQARRRRGLRAWARKLTAAQPESAK
jgi:hypothetical protein